MLQRRKKHLPSTRQYETKARGADDVEMPCELFSDSRCRAQGWKAHPVPSSVTELTGSHRDIFPLVNRRGIGRGRLIRTPVRANRATP